MDDRDDDGESRGMTAATLLDLWRRQRERKGMAATSASGARFVDIGDLSIEIPPATVRLSGVEASGSVGDVTVSMAFPPDVSEEPSGGLAPEVLVGVSLVDVQSDRTDDGQIILAVTPMWTRILDEMARDPNALYRLLKPRQFEEFIAGAYEEEGCDVTLTPRSGDGGRDIIAWRADFGGIRILDQVKLLRPGRRVKAEEVRALYGVFARDEGATKAIFTTTSRFAPGIEKEFKDLIPNRLVLRNGQSLREQLAQLRANMKAGKRQRGDS
jgi:restriction system protein